MQMNRALYHIQPYKEIEKNILVLSDFFVDQGITEVGNNLGSDIVKLSLEIKTKDIANLEWTVKERIISMIDKDLLSAIQREKGTKNESAILNEQLKLILSFLRRIPGCRLYSVSDVNAILAGVKPNYDKLNLAFTMRDALATKEGRDMALYIINYLCEEKWRSENMSWDEAFEETLYLHVAFSYFSLIGRALRAKLLRFCFYRALVANVPVKFFLEAYLRETTDPVAYFEECSFLWNNLAENTEQVLIRTDGSEKEFLFRLYKESSVNLGDELDVKMLGKYSKQKYDGQSNSEVFAKWLYHALSIMRLIENGVLIKKNRSGEPTEKNLYENELAQLYVWFLDRQWAKISEYYHGQDPISLSNFLLPLASGVDFEDARIINLYVEFNDFLHEKDLLPKDKDIIIFHESDGQFHWNDALISGEEKTMEIAK